MITIIIRRQFQALSGSEVTMAERGSFILRCHGDASFCSDITGTVKMVIYPDMIAINQVSSKHETLSKCWFNDGLGS